MRTLLLMLGGGVLALVALFAVAVFFVADEFDDVESDDPATESNDEAGADACSPEAVGEDAGPIVVVYEVDRGTLGDPCFGEADETTEAAWDELAQFVPPQELDALTLFAGFESDDGTLAFAGPMDDGHETFVIAVDLITAADDPSELKLTMAHEYAHVITQVRLQIDPSAGPDECATFHNGNGCFLDGSFMDDWIEQFWSADELASLPADGSEDVEGAEDRCELDSGFLGAYAASHPEEDFAETFSAFVFDLDVPASIEPKMDFMADRVDLLGYQDRALASSDELPANTFDRCG